MPDLMATLRTDQVAARKGGDKYRTLLLGTVLAALKNRELDAAEPLTDAQVVEVLRKQIKQREDSVQQFTAAARPDLAAMEQSEIALLRGYLPPEIDPTEIRATADAGGDPYRTLLMSPTAARPGAAAARNAAPFANAARRPGPAAVRAWTPSQAASGTASGARFGRMSTAIDARNPAAAARGTVFPATASQESAQAAVTGTSDIGESDIRRNVGLVATSHAAPSPAPAESRRRPSAKVA
jgi:uncharacterized protein YqeY